MRYSGFSYRLLSAAAWTLLALAPATAVADHCKWRFATGFQLVAESPLAGLSQAQIAGMIDEAFGTQQAVCEEPAYRFFLTQFSSYASTAFHKQGAEREAALLASQEILKRAPAQVFTKNTAAKETAYKQLRSDLSVVATEVGETPSIKAVLDAVERMGPPKVSPKPEPMNDDAIQVKVPKVPLPPWAVISLYEIYDHTQHKQNGAAALKTGRILTWMQLVTAGVPSKNIKVLPMPPGKTPAPK